MVSKCLQYQDFNCASCPPPFVRCLQEALQVPDRLTDRAVCTVAPISSQKYPGQSDVLELTQVAEVVLGGQSLLTRPAKGFTQPPLCDPYPCLQRRDRTHIWGKVTYIQALCLLEQVESTVQISLCLSDS